MMARFIYDQLTVSQMLLHSSSIQHKSFSSTLYPLSHQRAEKTVLASVRPRSRPPRSACHFASLLLLRARDRLTHIHT